MPQLTKFTATLPPDHSDDDLAKLLSVLARHVSHGWEEESLPTGEMQCVVYFTHERLSDELWAALAEALPSLRPDRETVEEENWVEAWKEFFTPVPGGSHFLVLAPWMEEERKTTERMPVLIEPKTAFGTGHHATTSLCLDALSDLYSRGAIDKNTRFLDLGTGSGILGIGAALLGLSGEGLDIDIAAVDNAIENRELNNIPQQMFPVALGGVEKASGPYDLVMANILAGPLREMAPNIVAALDKGDGKRGILVLSGILDIQADAVEEAYIHQGLPKAERATRGEWVCLLFA